MRKFQLSCSGPTVSSRPSGQARTSAPDRGVISTHSYGVVASARRDLNDAIAVGEVPTACAVYGRAVAG
jgi:hypothetical protein